MALVEVGKWSSPFTMAGRPSAMRDRIVASSHRAQGLFWLGVARRGSSRVYRKRTMLRMVQ
jgi:hypothetical protein